MECNLKPPNSSVAQKFIRIVNDDLLCGLITVYCDTDSTCGKAIPDKGQSDEPDDSGKPIPNPMPDDLDEPLQLKHHHWHRCGHH